MQFKNFPRRTGDPPPLPAAPLVRALRLLDEAARTAREIGRGPWDFAVEVRQLSATGLSHSDLRRLLCEGYVCSAEETTRPEEKGRTFQPSVNLSFTERTCFVLAPAGEAALHTLSGYDAGSSSEASTSSEPREPGMPRWDRASRTLYWGHLAVKRYAVPAPNQECVLDAFEEEGWPSHLLDPLSGKTRQNPKQRLHDTIKNLNRNQLHPVLHFRGDGTGEGVCWEAGEESFPRSSPD